MHMGALASYAKQAEDETLMKMATRIKARAVRRSGELLKQIEPAANRHGNSSGMGDHTSSRADAARDAGMSKHQQVQATRVASVPDQDFEAQVESDRPPTLSQLAQQGINPRPVVDLHGRGEVAGQGGNHGNQFAKVKASNVATAADLGLRRDEIHEARQLRDAEKMGQGGRRRYLAHTPCQNCIRVTRRAEIACLSVLVAAPLR